MDINECFQDFVDDSRIDYSDTHIIMAYPDEVYRVSNSMLADTGLTNKPLEIFSIM